MAMTRRCALNIEAIEKVTLDYRQAQQFFYCVAIVKSKVALTVFRLDGRVYPEGES
jgi:hypothetical protein